MPWTCPPTPAPWAETVLERLTNPEGVLAMPDGPPRAAMLVLSGSSGGVEEERCRIFASHGVAALSVRWFGGIRQPPGICEVPLESFGPALDRLAGLSTQLVMFGISKSAEAAMLLAAHDPRITHTVALSPSSVVWANVGAGSDGVDFPYRSSWTWRGEPLPFVPYDDSWEVPRGEWPSYVGLYDKSLRTFSDAVDAARIPVEHITGELIVTAGGDDQVWPSHAFASAIVQRRRLAGLDTTAVLHPGAGHRAVLPGEAPSFGLGSARGGSAGADTEHGTAIWAAVTKSLALI
jgi:uncharacterized protein